MRLFLAFAVFFRVLFGKRLPDDFPAELLPPPPERMDEQKLLEEAKPKVTDPAQIKKTISGGQISPLASIPPPAPAPAKPTAAATDGAGRDDGALQLLALLQREGRLVDFLRESIDAYDDATIGAAVRDIHKGCKKAIEEHFVLAPVMSGTENDAVTVDKGFDAQRIRLVGAVKGEPPFKGTLRHHGWLAQKVTLPKATGGLDHTVVAPAEVELP